MKRIVKIVGSLAVAAGLAVPAALIATYGSSERANAAPVLPTTQAKSQVSTTAAPAVPTSAAKAAAAPNAPALKAQNDTAAVAATDATTAAAATDQDDATAVYANFTKYYREPAGYTQNANTDLSGLGTVRALTISGLLPTTVNGTSIAVTELRLLDGTGARITNYKVERINYESTNIAAPASIDTTPGVTNYGLSDGTMSTAPLAALLASNISANMSFSIEITLPVPSVVSSIHMAQVLPATASATTVIGEIGVTTTDAVYRLFNYSTFANIPASDGTQENVVVGQAATALTWTKFSASGDTALSYVLVPKRDSVTAAFWQTRSAMYITDDSRYVHATPFADGGRLRVLIEDNAGTVATTDDTVKTYALDPLVSDTAQVDFLRQINDYDFWKEMLFRLGALTNKPTNKDQVTPQMLQALGNSTSTNLIFAIKMNGRDGAVAENSLSNMAALSMIRQISELNFNSAPSATPQTVQTFSYHINVFDQPWMGSFNSLRRIDFSAYGNTNNARDATNYKLIGDFADADWLLNSTSINVFNMTSYANYGDQQSIDAQMANATWFSDFLSQQISFTRTPQLIIPRNTALNNDPALDTKIISGVITENVNTRVSPAFYYYTVTTAQYVEYSRIPDPRIYNDLINGLVSTQLQVDDKFVSLFVKDSKLYWNYNAAGVIKNNIKAFYPKQQRFITVATRDSLIAAGTDPQDFLDLAQDVVNAAPDELITPRPVFEPLLTAFDFDTALKKFYIDEQPVQTTLYKSQMIVLSDLLSSCSYYYENEDSIHLFTDLPNLLRNFKQDAWATLGINQITPSTAPRQAYDDYKANGLTSFPDPTSTTYQNNPTITVDQTTYTIDDIEIYDSKFYWKLADGLDPSDIKYYDQRAYYTALDANMDWANGVSAIQPHDAYPINIFGTREMPKHFDLNDKTLPSLDSARILVDDVPYPAVLYRGDAYWNFDLNQIKYVTERSLDKKYYTTYRDTLLTESLYTVTQESRRIAGELAIAPAANGSVLRIKDNPGATATTYPSILVGGIWRYLVPDRSDFEQVKYVDYANNYLRNLGPNVADIYNYSISSVTPDFDSYARQTPDSRNSFPQSYDVASSLDLVEQGYSIDGVAYAFLIRNGKAYIEPKYYRSIYFITNSADRAYTTGFEQIEKLNRPLATSFSAIKNEDLTLPDDFNGVEIVAADGATHTIEVKDAEGLVRSLTVTSTMENGLQVYEFSDQALGSQIRYKTDKDRYLVTLKGLTADDGLVSQVKPFTAKSLQASQAHVGVAQPNDQDLRLVIAVAAIGGAALLALSLLSARLYFAYRRRSK